MDYIYDVNLTTKLTKLMVYGMAFFYGIYLGCFLLDFVI
jgi:hypothetical protein